MVAILHEGISRTVDDLRREGLWHGCRFGAPPAGGVTAGLRDGYARVGRRRSYRMKSAMLSVYTPLRPIEKSAAPSALTSPQITVVVPVCV